MLPILHFMPFSTSLLQSFIHNISNCFYFKYPLIGFLINRIYEFSFLNSYTVSSTIACRSKMLQLFFFFFVIGIRNVQWVKWSFFWIKCARPSCSCMWSLSFTHSMSTAVVARVSCPHLKNSRAKLDLQWILIEQMRFGLTQFCMR